MSNPIGWCDTTWNPIVGCSPVSSGCDNCYAARIASRFRKNGEQFAGMVTSLWPMAPRFSGSISFHPERLEQPFHWRKPRRIFVCSMGDLFHDSVTNDQIAAVFGVIAACPQHTFMILTKRPARALKTFDSNFGLETFEQTVAREASNFGTVWDSRGNNEWLYSSVPQNIKKRRAWSFPLPNLWIGVSVEDQKTADERLWRSLEIPSSHHFVSYEPAISGVDFDFLTQDFDLIICGSETGPRKRPMDLDWARSVRDQCAAAGVPFWFKKDSDGNETLDGVTHHPEFWR